MDTYTSGFVVLEWKEAEQIPKIPLKTMLRLLPDQEKTTRANLRRQLVAGGWRKESREERGMWRGAKRQTLWDSLVVNIVTSKTTCASARAFPDGSSVLLSCSKYSQGIWETRKWMCCEQVANTMLGISEFEFRLDWIYWHSTNNHSATV